jgi:hypothetical protein
VTDLHVKVGWKMEMIENKTESKNKVYSFKKKKYVKNSRKIGRINLIK